MMTNKEKLIILEAARLSGWYMRSEKTIFNQAYKILTKPTQAKQEEKCQNNKPQKQQSKQVKKPKQRKKAETGTTQHQTK